MWYKAHPLDNNNILITLFDNVLRAIWNLLSSATEKKSMSVRRTLFDNFICSGFGIELRPEHERVTFFFPPVKINGF